MSGPRTVAIIGPAACGKSTLAALAAEVLDRDFVDLDDVGDPFYAEVDQPLSALHRRIDEIGFVAAHRWWQPARAHAVVRVLEAHPGAVIAFGAGHSHFEDDAWFESVQAALRPHLVVALLPDPDPELALDALRARCLRIKGHRWIKGGVDFLAAWTFSEQNRRLADHVIFTGDDPSIDARQLSEAVLELER